MEVVQGTMTVLQYDKVINSVVVPFMNTTQNVIFQQDYVQSPTVAITRQAMQDILTMDCTARSPDLLLIQQAWDSIDRRSKSLSR